MKEYTIKCENYFDGILLFVAMTEILCWCTVPKYSGTPGICCTWSTASFFQQTRHAVCHCLGYEIYISINKIQALESSKQPSLGRQNCNPDSLCSSPLLYTMTCCFILAQVLMSPQSPWYWQSTGMTAQLLMTQNFHRSEINPLNQH